MSKMAFQPAPRPRPLTTPEEAERLREATQDLGFGRPTTAAGDPPPSAAAPVAAAAPALAPAALSRPAPSTAPTTGPTTAPSTGEAPARKAPALKFDIPDPLWDELRIAAVKRRVTVKYLVLEALGAQGYEVDLAAIPEDGRRLR